MAEDTETMSVITEQMEQFTTLGSHISSEPGLQTALIILGAGLVAIYGFNFKLKMWISSKKIHYFHPFLSLFIQYAILPLFAVVLVTSVNVYLHSFPIFEEIPYFLESEFSPRIAFVKIIDSINIVVVGWVVANAIYILIFKNKKDKEERQDFENWKAMGGFADDDGDPFHRLYKWVPPLNPPDELTEEEFKNYLSTDEGILFLERFRTSKGHPIGSYEKLVKHSFKEWKKSERKKYKKYFEDCTSGNNDSGRKLVPGRRTEEIYPIDVWRQEKRMVHYSKIGAGKRPPGYAKNKRKKTPKSFARLIPLGIFVGVVLGVLNWWGIDFIILATATGGLAIGVGFALQESIQNYFAYVQIRKDKILVEDDRVQLDTGYNGYVHKITSRVTYVRDALNESIAIVPTKSLLNSQVINYTKEEKIVPAIVDVGVSYLNDPKQVAAILVKVGKRVMKESLDNRGRHLIRQTRCPYLDKHKASCGCDKDIHVEINQPVVRFNQFNDSALDFSLWLYVMDYGSQFKVKTDMRMIMYEEFKKHDIRIPWPIRTVYQGDEKREVEEIDAKSEDRKKIIEKFGIGNTSDSNS